MRRALFGRMILQECHNFLNSPKNFFDWVYILEGNGTSNEGQHFAAATMFWFIDRLSSPPESH